MSREVEVNLIGSATTETDIEIRSELDEGSDPLGQEVTDEQMERLSIKREKFDGECKYTFLPRQRPISDHPSEGTS